MLPTKFRFIWSSGCTGEDFSKSTNQKRELYVAAMFVNESGRNEHYSQRTFHICFMPCFATYQVSFQLVMRFQRIIFVKNRPIRNKNCLWRSCLLSDRDEQSTLYRTPYNDASFKVSVQLTKGIQKRRLKCYKSNRRTTTTGYGPSDDNSSRCLWQDELKINVQEI